jgi:hypothetical protein
MNMKQIKKATKKELIEYLLLLNEQFSGYATIIEDDDQ